MLRSRDVSPVPGVLAERLTDASVRHLFSRFCGEVGLFSGSITVETTPFEIRFSDPPGFCMRVAPYRELFRVSIEYPNPCDVRVNDRQGYLSALDLALKSFLDSRAQPFGEAGTGGSAGGNAAPPAAGP